jgi:type I restriction enzyme S subunit
MEFKKYKLGEIGEICMCKRIMKAETSESGDVPFYKIGTFGGTPDVYIARDLFEDYKEKYSFPKTGDVLISAAGTIGRTVIYNGEDAYYQDSNIVWIDNDESKVLNNYLYYLYKNIKWKISTGSTILRLYNDNIRETEVVVPNIEDQHVISSFLALLDKKIALNTRLNAELEAMAKQLYDYWFVQFNFPDENGYPYKSSGGEMVYNSTLKREIPAGWEVKNLFYIANYYNGLACQNYRPQEGEDSLPVIKITEMHNGFTSETERASASIPSEAIIENGDVLFAWSASLEVMLWGLGKGALNQHIFKVTSNNGFPKSFYYFQLMEYVGHFKKIAEAKKTTMGHITKDHLEQSQIVVPPSTNLPDKLEEIITPLLDKMVSLSSERIYLTHLRDSLLPMLMNGQLTIE